ncbi:MAG: hypothetical protein HYX41_05270, partial [Bdellovibrio sp.]|nr:hypothetical protein [Bdellovibrio sp.]
MKKKNLSFRFGLICTAGLATLGGTAYAHCPGGQITDIGRQVIHSLVEDKAQQDRLVKIYCGQEKTGGTFSRDDSSFIKNVEILEAWKSRSAREDGPTREQEFNAAQLAIRKLSTLKNGDSAHLAEWHTRTELLSDSRKSKETKTRLSELQKSVSRTSDELTEQKKSLESLEQTRRKLEMSLGSKNLQGKNADQIKEQLAQVEKSISSARAVGLELISKKHQETLALNQLRAVDFALDTVTQERVVAIGEQKKEVSLETLSEQAAKAKLAIQTYLMGKKRNFDPKKPDCFEVGDNIEALANQLFSFGAIQEAKNNADEQREKLKSEHTRLYEVTPDNRRKETLIRNQEFLDRQLKEATQETEDLKTRAALLSNWAESY